MRVRRHWGPTCSNCRARKVKCPRGTPICDACRGSEKLSATCIYDKRPSAAYLRSVSSASTSVATPKHTQPSLINLSDERAASATPAAHLAHSPDDTTIRTFDPPIAEVPSIVTSPIQSPLVVAHCTYSVNSRGIVERAIDNLHFYAGLPVASIRRLLYYAFTWIQPSYQIFCMSSLLQRCANAQSLETMPPIGWIALTHADRFLGYASKRTMQEQQQSQHLRTVCQQTLATCMYGPPSLSSVEAFLQQAGSNVGAGEASQAWVNSGIAFRLASEVGLFKPDRKVPDVSDVTAYRNFAELRRLFWSMYSFDKALAVYLGRTPFITAIPPQFVLRSPQDAAGANVDPNTVDLSEPHIESKMWYEEATPVHTVTTVKLHRSACFFQTCELMQKVQRALELLYYPKDEMGRLHGRLNDPRWLLKDTRSTNGKVEDLCMDLRDWWSFVPRTLKIESHRVALQPEIFPCNIINLNIWYHTLTILIRRVDLIQHAAEQISPSTHSPADHICMTAASAIEAIVRLCLRTTGYHRLGFGLAYGVYTAATAVTFPLVRLASTTYRNGEEIATSEPAALLGFFIDTLSKMRSAMPGVDRSYRKLCQYVIHILGRQIAHQIFIFQDDEDTSMVRHDGARSVPAHEDDAIEMLLNLIKPVDDTQQQTSRHASDTSSLQSTAPINLDELFSLPIFPGPMPDFQIDLENIEMELAVHDDLFT